MYKLAPEALKPGCTLRDILRMRKEVGTFANDPDKYSAKLVERRTGASTATPILPNSPTEGVEHKVFELPDGRTMSVTNQAMPGGGWVSTHTDITESTRAAKELERTKTFLNTVVESVPATLVVKDARDQRYVLINRAGEKFFGISARADARKDRARILSEGGGRRDRRPR